MHFTIGPWKYRVRISEGQLHTADGKDADGMCCWSDRIIHLNGTLPLQQRLDVLLHELSHAWDQTFGTAGEGEASANRAASFTTDVWRQLERQGGISALMRLRPDGIVDTAQAAEALNDAYAVQVKCCGNMMGIGSVHTAPARFDAKLGCLVVDRDVTCPDCGVKQTWVEGATVTGKPNGRVLSEPVLESECVQVT